MKLPELLELQESLIGRIADAREEAKAEIKGKIEEIAAESGLTLEDILGEVKKPAGAKKKANLPPKFRNPSNAEETWHGKGVRPQWVKDFVAAGGDLDSALISG